MSQQSKPYGPNHMINSANAILEMIHWMVVAHPPALPRAQVVVDLDGTLFDNSRRTIKIVQAYAKDEGWHEELPAVIDHSGLGYGPLSVFDLLQDKYGFSVPIQSREKFRAFWRSRFFTDTWQRHDEVALGSPQFIRAVLEFGVNVVYLTGRDLPCMARGVVASLRDGGFPVMTAHTQIVLKQTFEMSDIAFKRSAMTELERNGRIIAFIDNEPPICNMVADTFNLSSGLSGISVLIDAAHKPNPPPLLSDVRVMCDFQLN